MNKIIFKNFGNQKNWINGKYHNSKSNKNISVVSPYYDREIATIPDSNLQDLNFAVERAYFSLSCHILITLSFAYNFRLCLW